MKGLREPPADYAGTLPHPPKLAGKRDEDRAGVVGLPARVERLGKARRQAQAVYTYLTGAGSASVRTPADRARVAALGRCASWLQFRHWLHHDEVRLHAADFCRQSMLCQACAVRRSGKLAGQFLPKIEAVVASAPTTILAFLTLTIRNRSDLEDAFRHLTSSFLVLRDRGRDQRKKGRGASEFRKVAGYVASIEITHNGKGWHPHMHLIVALDRYVDQRALSAEWLGITGDSRIVDIRQVDRSDPMNAVAELLKYQLKFSTMTPGRVWEAASVLRGRRLLSSAGVFWGIKEPEVLTDEPLDGPFRDYLYRWLDGCGYSL